jgi:arginase family enzyme
MVTAIDFVEVDAETDRDGVTLDAMAHLVLAAVAGYAERS